MRFDGTRGSLLLPDWVILSAVYMLWMFQRVYYGEVTHEENATLRDLLPREWAAVVPCAYFLAMGVFRHSSLNQWRRPLTPSCNASSKAGRFGPSGLKLPNVPNASNGD